jgi:hypothetical protein
VYRIARRTAQIKQDVKIVWTLRQYPIERSLGPVVQTHARADDPERETHAWISVCTRPKTVHNSQGPAVQTCGLRGFRAKQFNRRAGILDFRKVLQRCSALLPVRSNAGQLQVCVLVRRVEF